MSVLIPVYNERSTFLAVLERLRQVPFPGPTEFVIVDDASTDRTTELLRNQPARPDLHIRFHGCDAGKGAAVQTALAHARGSIIVVQDADQELDPDDLLRLLARRGETAAAKECFEQALALQPDYAAAPANLQRLTSGAPTPAPPPSPSLTG